MSVPMETLSETESEAVSKSLKMTSDLTPEALHKFLLAMKGSIQMARISIIHHHARLIAKLKALVKKNVSSEDQKNLSASALKNKRKAVKLKNEVKTLKNLRNNDVGKLVLLNSKDFKTATKEGAGAGVSAICRLAEHKAVVEQKLLFRKQFGDSVSQLPFCVKVLGAERRSKKLRLLKNDKKSRMLEYERRLFKLFQEIGGEEFEAAERLYLKVVKMKKTLEKRKKKEKAWALAQGPLGDRRAAYEEYLKTLDEGEEKQSFASYVEEMSMKKTEDSSDTEKTTLEAHEFSDEDCASSLDDEGSSDEEGNVAPNEESDLKQLELRNKIFEKLDAKLGKWNEEDSSDAEDIDIMPDTTKSLFTNDGNVSKQRKHVSQSVSSKSNVCEFEFARSQKNIDNRKRKRDSSLNDSEIDFSSNKKTILKSDEFFPSREALLKRDSELKIKSADSNKSAERDNIAKSSVNLSNEYQLDSGADTEKSHPSLFSLFKKTGFTTKRGKLSPEKKAKKPDALDLKIVASLYNKNNKPLAKSSFFVASFSSGTQNTNENTKDDAARIDDSVVPHRVLEMETELAEIPRPIAYEKAQKLNKEGMLDDDVSDDDQDERANFNSMFIFDNAKNFKQARGESSRNGSMSDSGRGRGVRGGRGARHDGRPRAKCGSDEDFGSTTPGRGKHNGRLPDAKLVEGRKFDVGGTGRGGTRGGKRAQRGGRSTAPYAATRSNDDSELLHPSWAAKKQNSGAIKGFQGKKITFD